MILVTGVAGMIGKHLLESLLREGFEVIGVDRKSSGLENDKYIELQIDLADRAAIEEIYKNHSISHTIHLAALAHSNNVNDLSDEAYRQANVVNAQNIFTAAKQSKILFISTVDVYGFTKCKVDDKTKLHPVTIYGKTKAEAEAILRSQGGHYDIFRFSPVYTENIKRDIQKRYYLKYPNWAYQIGKGSCYEVLNIVNAVGAMVEWVVKDQCKQSVRIIKDKDMLDTKVVLKRERTEGRAKHILHFPRWMVNIGYKLLLITGKNKYTYLLNKAVHPLRSE